MLGAQDMESKVLGSYAAWVAKHHPEATTPAVYADQGLFEDARRLRATLGDDAFFSKLNGGVQQAASGWGKLAEARKWDASTFDAAAGATYVGESDRDAQSPRAKLFSDLVRTFFTSWTAQQGRFVDLDTGLGVISRHAKSIGFDAIVLYLDELVLWLAGNSSDLPFVGREVQKMVKLKEAQDADRAIPIVSFIARQRDLSQFLGEQAQGAVRTELSRNLSHHDGRFETVTLADSNLPAIVAHRVVRPKDASAAQRLADDFAKTWRAAGQAQSILIGSEGDEADFKKVYPFSPALVEALVALSDCLQRERTAIRILMELLVNHLPDLQTGRVVPVGVVLFDDIRSQLAGRAARGESILGEDRQLPYVHHGIDADAEGADRVTFTWCSWSPGVVRDTATGAVVDDTVGQGTGTGVAERIDGTWMLASLDESTLDLLPAGTADPCPGADRSRP